MFQKAAQLKYKKRTFFYAGHCLSQKSYYSDVCRLIEMPHYRKAVSAMRNYQYRRLHTMLKMCSNS